MSSFFSSSSSSSQRRSGRRPLGRNGRNFRRVRPVNRQEIDAVQETTPIPRVINPVPPALTTMLAHTAVGYIASTSTSGNYGMSGNNIVTPLSNKGGATSTFPNNSGGNPAGLLNFLFNSSTTTGLYNFYSVIATKVIFTIVPGALADQVYAALAAVDTATGGFTSPVQASDSPNTVSRLFNCAASRQGNTFSMQINWPRVLGLPMASYLAATRANFSTGPTVPTYIHFVWSAPDGVGLANNCTYQLRLEHTVRFFLRADSQLED